MDLRRVVIVGKSTELQQLARPVSQEIFVADDIAEALDVVETVKPELVLFNHQFTPDCICKFIKTSDKNSDLHIVVIDKDEDNIHAPEEFIQIGVHDYLHGRKDHHRLKQIVNRIKNKRGISTPNHKNTDNFFADDLAALVSMVGRSKAALHTLKMIRLVAASQCNPVLIIGETGTGKEVTAKAIHILRHQNEPFVAVNCAALTANLLESELFGHAKGAFTSADCEKTGLLELAQSGTILLDEISEMPMELQAKLLRILQEKTFRKVGGTKEIACNATIIASSNRNLKREVQLKRFREDLFYRLDTCPVANAPLRAPERRQDIPLLIEYFINASTISPQKTKKINSITKLALEALQEHHWPGNVRELRNVIDRAILLETTNKIGLSSIMIESTESGAFPHSEMADKIKCFSLAKAECELIARALQETNWQKTNAAKLLGISRATLYAKVKEHNIKKGSRAESSTQETQDEISASSPHKPLAIA